MHTFVYTPEAGGYLPWMWEYPEFTGHPKQAANFVFGDGHTEAKLESEVITLTGDDLDKWRGTATE